MRRFNLPLREFELTFSLQIRESMHCFALCVLAVAMVVLPAAAQLVCPADSPMDLGSLTVDTTTDPQWGLLAGPSTNTNIYIGYAKTAPDNVRWI